jgi:hypothetical protein
MKISLIACAIGAGLTSSAFAGTPDSPPPPPAFVAWTVTQQDADEISKFLLEQPYKFSAPIYDWLARHEQRAQLLAIAEANRVKAAAAIEAQKAKADPVAPSDTTK